MFQCIKGSICLSWILTLNLIFSVLTRSQTVIAGHLSRTPHNLSCYECNTLNHGDTCRNLQYNNSALQRSCKTSQMFCSVILFRYSADSSEYFFWSIERRCEETCHEGCNTVGERVKLFLCRSCCNKYLCNYGNFGTENATPNDKYLILIAGMALYRYFTFFKSLETLL
nr:uncharacterized protein LOC107445942 [Parasteatoda tepidariorum]